MVRCPPQVCHYGTATSLTGPYAISKSGDYLRHYDYQLRVDPTDGTDLFRTDSSFVPVTAWA